MNIGVTCWKCILDPLPETVRDKPNIMTAPLAGKLAGE